jgi:hypothetical protein
MIRVEGHQNLYRDERSGAIINCDTVAYNQYITTLQKKEEHKREIQQLKNDVEEIKSLLKEFINGSKSD